MSWNEAARRRRALWCVLPLRRAWALACWAAIVAGIVLCFHLEHHPFAISKYRWVLRDEVLISFVLSRRTCDGQLASELFALLFGSDEKVFSRSLTNFRCILVWLPLPLLLVLFAGFPILWEVNNFTDSTCTCRLKYLMACLNLPWDFFSWLQCSELCFWWLIFARKASKPATFKALHQADSQFLRWWNRSMPSSCLTSIQHCCTFALCFRFPRHNQKTKRHNSYSSHLVAGQSSQWLKGFRILWYKSGAEVAVEALLLNNFLSPFTLWLCSFQPLSCVRFVQVRQVPKLRIVCLIFGSLYIARIWNPAQHTWFQWSHWYHFSKYPQSASLQSPRTRSFCHHSAPFATEGQALKSKCMKALHAASSTKTSWRALDHFGP